MYGLRHAFVPPKISAEQPEHRVTGRLVGSFRSIGDHLALHNDDCTGYSAIIRDRGDRAATSEQQGCAESGCIHHLTEVSSHSRSPLFARSSSPCAVSRCDHCGAGVISTRITSSKPKLCHPFIRSHPCSHRHTIASCAPEAFLQDNR